MFTKKPKTYQPKNSIRLMRYTKKQSINFKRNWLVWLKEKWQTYKKYQKHKQRKRVLSLQLFDLTKPCPDDIINCHELREQFLSQIAQLQRVNVCTSCNISLLKESIIKKIII